ncbi:hypothetical protein HZB03_01715 [Candidatus Woesearchaeota archaeon]|nr:hypothetical protein [Candidatus Woesearchaeota archaeon]
MEISTLITETKKPHNEKLRSLRQGSILRLKYQHQQKSEPHTTHKSAIDYFFNHMKEHIVMNRGLLQKRTNGPAFAPEDLRKQTIQQLYFQQFRKLTVGA